MQQKCHNIFANCNFNFFATFFNIPKQSYLATGHGHATSAPNECFLLASELPGARKCLVFDVFAQSHVGVKSWNVQCSSHMPCLNYMRVSSSYLFCCGRFGRIKQNFHWAFSAYTIAKTSELQVSSTQMHVNLNERACDVRMPYVNCKHLSNPKVSCSSYFVKFST